MRRLLLALVILTLALVPARALAGPRVHVVASGHTLGKVAKRYHVTVEAICTANDIQRNKPIRVGQKLVIPDPDDKDGSRAARARKKAEPRSPARRGGSEPPESRGGGPEVLEVPGSPPAYYYSPTGPGRLSLRPVIFYLHGRSGYPRADCQRWARVARPRGWLVCPSGVEERGNGSRGWNNNWAQAHRTIMATLGALRAKFGRRVQLYGNTLVGFSEGAYVAMNVGLREPRAFNRWLILAASDQYWGGQGVELLQQSRRRLRRVFLITGEEDSVIEGTKQVLKWLKRAGVPTRVSLPKDMGHEVPLQSRAGLYADALAWLERGG